MGSGGEIMTIIKTWTKEAHGIKYHPVSLAYDEERQVLTWSRSYYFVDETGKKIDERGAMLFEINYGVSGEMLWADVPQNVKDALITIDTYTKDQIRQKEGIGSS